MVLPQAPQHEEVAIEREPWRNRPVVAHLEAGERALDAGLGPVGMGATQHRLQIVTGGAHERWGAQRGGALVPIGEAPSELDRAAVDAADRPGRSREPGRELDHHVAAPGLAHQHRPIEPGWRPPPRRGRRSRSSCRSRRRAWTSGRARAGRRRAPGGRRRPVRRRRRPRGGRWRRARGRARTARRHRRPSAGRAARRRRRRGSDSVRSGPAISRERDELRLGGHW